MPVVKISRDVKILLAAMSLGSFATAALITVVGLQVFSITSRELDLGLLGIAEFLPILLLSPCSGILADRFDRRRVYGAGLGIDAVVTVCLALFVSTDPSAVLPIMILMGVYGIGRSVGTPAGRALPIDLGTEYSIERIVALRSVTFQLARIAGPIVGALANRTSDVAPYLIVLAAQAAAMLLLVTVADPKTDRLVSAPGPRQAVRDAVEGLRFIRRTPVVFGAISLDLFAVLFGGAVALLPAIVEKRLNFDDVDLGVGILAACIGASSALTALILSIRPLSRRTGCILFGVVAIFGISQILLGLTHSFAVAVVAVIVGGSADQVSVFIRAALVPLATPEAMRGRVLAVENVFIGGSNELGAFESGAAATLVGLGPAIVLGGSATLLVVAVGWLVFPDLRRVDRFAEVRPATP